MARQINVGGHLIRQFGAYIQTDLSNLVEINGVASGIIGVLGLAEKGPVDEAVEVNSYTELVETFGDGPLVRHGLAMYVGGASRLICVRIGSPEASQLSAVNANTSNDSSYNFVAKEQGSLGNNIAIKVDETTDLNDKLTHTLEVKYTDPAGNDVRETFVVPRNVPVAKFYGASGTNPEYFILRDTNTNTMREVPVAWTFGNSDKDAFQNKVENLKDSNEELIELPTVFDDNGVETAVPFPLFIIQSIINDGSFGQAKSSLVNLTDVNPSVDSVLIPGYAYDPTTSDELAAHPYVFLGGGNNGDDGTNYYGTKGVTGTSYDMTFTSNSDQFRDTWQGGLSVLESEEVNFVQPAYLFTEKKNLIIDQGTGNVSLGNKGDGVTWERRYAFFKALIPYLIAHTNVMSSVPNRLFRSCIVGTPYYLSGSTTAGNTAKDFLEEIQELSGLLNNDRFQIWVGGFKSSAFSANVENYGGEMLSSFVAGAQAASDVSVSFTFARMSGIFSDGLEFAWNSGQREELYARSLAFVLKRRRSTGVIEYLAAHNYTSFTGSPSRGIQLLVTRRIVDYMNTFIYKNLEETFIGAKSLGGETENRIRTFVLSLLNRLVREGTLVAFDNVRVYADENDKTKYDVEFDFQPVTEIDFIVVTNRLTYSLA